MVAKPIIVECPVCGKSIEEKNLIFHFRKRAVFEVYDWFKGVATAGIISADAGLKSCPHEQYMQENVTFEKKFKV